MESIFSELVKPSFWVLGVLFGIVINLASTYLKPSLDGIFSGLSSRWSQRSKAAKSKWAARIHLMCVDEAERKFQYADEIRGRLRALQYLLIATLLFAIARDLNHLPLSESGIKLVRKAVDGFALLVFFGSFLEVRASTETARALRAAHEISTMV